jgi:hypothetical protein
MSKGKSKDKVKDNGKDKVKNTSKNKSKSAMNKRKSALGCKEPINKVTLEVLLSVIEEYKPEGLFIAKEGGKYVGVDNRTGEAWTESFRTKRKCKKWLRGCY